MKRFATLVVGLTIISAAMASAAMASTTSVRMTFAEPSGPSGDCPAADFPNGGFCGSGIVLPYGHATETIEFGAGCGGDCDLRTVTLTDGSILMEEHASGFFECERCHNENGGPFGAALTDVVIGGTGSFEGATGTLSGTVEGTGHRAQVQLSGTISVSS